MYMKKRTRILSVFLTVAILISSMVIVIPATAEDTGAGSDAVAKNPTEFWSDHHAQSFAGGVRYGTTGYGTASKPYSISNAEELAYLAWIVNRGEGNSVSGKHFVLTADIDLSEYLWVPIAKSFTADAKYDFTGTGVKEARRHTFAGIFDGGGYTISGLNFNNNMLDSNGNLSAVYGGLALFGRLAGTKDAEGRAIVTATVKNVNIVGSANVEKYAGQSSQFAAPITMVATAAYDASLIENVHVTTEMNITPRGEEINIAGIVGYATNLAKISNCSVSGSITVDGTVSSKIPCVGGIVARIGNAVIIENCVNKADIVAKAKGTLALVGGIAAKTHGGAYTDESLPLTPGMNALATIVNCINYGDITVENTLGSSVSGARVGGMIGDAGRSLKGDALMQNCFNFGVLSADYIGEFGGIGAMVGCQETRRVQLTNCYSFTDTVNVKGDDPKFESAFICNMGGMKQTNDKIFYDTKEYYTPSNCRFLAPDFIEAYEGAALRINPTKEEIASLRFEAKVGGQVLNVLGGKEVTMSTIVVKARDLDLALQQYSDMETALANVPSDSVLTTTVIDQKSNGAFSSVLTNLKGDKHAIDYVAISYVTFLIDEESDFSLTFYTDYEIGDKTRVVSVKSIAEVYYEMRQDTPDGVYANEVSVNHDPTLGKYSMFTKAQLDNFLLYMSAEAEDVGNGSNGLDEVDENRNS